MSTILTPGIAFILRILFFLSLYFVCFYTVVHHALPMLPAWFLCALAPVSLFLGAKARIHLTHLYHARRAASLGARVAPRIQGKWPFNADLYYIIEMDATTGYPGNSFLQWEKDYGVIYDLDALGQTLLATTSPKHIQMILSTEFRNYEKGKTFRNALYPVLGQGIFTADGDIWRSHRTMARPFFTRDRITHFDVFDRHSEIAITKMKDHLRSGNPVEFQDLMLRFSMDAASEFLFGESVGSLSSSELPLPHAEDAAINSKDFSSAFRKTLNGVAQRERLEILSPFLEIKEDVLEKHLKVVLAHMEPIVQGAIDKQRHEMDHDIDKTVDRKVPRDDDHMLAYLTRMVNDTTMIRDEILNILIAARDAIATTVSYTVYFLSQHPEATIRLREEILSKVGGTRRPEIEDIKDMKYLRAVINETLRLYPPVPFNIRESVEETLLPSDDPAGLPTYVPSRTRIIYSIMHTHRRKDLWGPDAEEFDPLRFLDARFKKYLEPNPSIFLPFNTGPRICLGQQFAYNIMSFVLVRLMQNFESFKLREDASSVKCPPEWKSCEGRMGKEKVVPRVSLTLFIEGGMWIDATEAKD